MRCEFAISKALSPDLSLPHKNNGGCYHCVVTVSTEAEFLGYLCVAVNITTGELQYISPLSSLSYLIEPELQNCEPAIKAAIMAFKLTGEQLSIPGDIRKKAPNGMGR